MKKTYYFKVKSKDPVDSEWVHYWAIANDDHDAECDIIEKHKLYNHIIVFEKSEVIQ